jgi:hypothetical protein
MQFSSIAYRHTEVRKLMLPFSMDLEALFSIKPKTVFTYKKPYSPLY